MDFNGIRSKTIANKWLTYIELAIIVIPTVFPLLFNLPYRINIFLSWEGAYRLYLGQIPFKDFGLPLGIGYWIIPAIFFKIFGPYLFTLVKAQVFINLISLLAFRNILKLLEVDKPLRILSVLVFVLSYSFSNFWPWYNHSVFVFQLVAMNLTLWALFSDKELKWPAVLGSAFFVTWSFFTKQDSGALAIIFCALLFLYDAVSRRNWSYLLQYISFTCIFLLLSILPFIEHNFFYWFNYGQPPHNSRISLYYFLIVTFGDSDLQKFYIVLICLAIWGKLKFKFFFKDQRLVVFLLVVLGIILQSLIIKVTSPLPTGHATYYHAFVFAFILVNFNLPVRWNSVVPFSAFALLVILWWSALYWDYASRILKVSPPPATTTPDFSRIQSKWATSDLRSFNKILMPKETIEGINELLSMDLAKAGNDLKVLNMTELTPLAYEMGYEPLTNQPLWFHLNVGIFANEVKMLNNNVKEGLYDIVLFQSIPGLEDFFPYEIQKTLQEHYELVNTFEAPRKRSEGYSFIEVYVKDPTTKIE